MKKQIYVTCILLLVTICVNAQYSGGTGTQQDPFLISSRDDLVTLASNVGYNSNYYSGKYFLMTNDVKGFYLTIGTGPYDNLPFKGTFNGGGHTIELNIDNTLSTNYSGTYGGLFAWIDGATVLNLRVTGSVNSDSEFSGGICGKASNSNIYNCCNAAEIYNSDISFNAYAGGICGMSLSSSIINCLNIGNITSSIYGGISGGISGYALDRTEIVRCFAKNEFISGSRGTTAGTSGRILGRMIVNDVVKIENCYASPYIKVDLVVLNSQNASSKDGKDLSDAPQCSHIERLIILEDAFNAVRWERSEKNIMLWQNISNTGFLLIETNPPSGNYLYRALLADGTYSKTIEVTYKELVPNVINVSPISSSLTVDEPIVLTLDTNDSTYHYQWYKDGMIISDATSCNLIIPKAKSIYSGVYTCIVNNDCGSVTSSIAKVSINKAPQQINFPEITTKTYGNTPFALTSTSNKGLNITYNSNNPQVAIANKNIISIIGAGTAEIVASQDGTSDYLEACPVTRTITVNKAQLTISADNKHRNIGEANPEFTLSYSGFKNNDNENVLDVLPFISCEADENSQAGIYNITLSGGKDNNYDYILTGGKLEVVNIANNLNDLKTTNIFIYPNPVSDRFFISSRIPIIKVEVNSLTDGLLLLDNNLNKSISVSSLPKGIYLVKIYTEKGVTVRKIIKK